MRPILLAILGVVIAGAVRAEPRPAPSAPRAASAARNAGPLFGPQASYGDDADFGVGGRVVWGVGGSLDLVTSFDYFFPSSSDGVASVERKHWEINGNLAYTFGMSLNPYLGAGLNVARRSSTLKFLGKETGSSSGTDLGLNLLAGLRSGRRSGLRFFLEGRAEVKGGEQLVLTIGVLF